VIDKGLDYFRTISAKSLQTPLIMSFKYKGKCVLFSDFLVPMAFEYHVCEQALMISTKIQIRDKERTG
jgi:hypothetical protein